MHRLAPLSVFALSALATGCGESVTQVATGVYQTPAEVLVPKAPDESKAEAKPAAEAKPSTKAKPTAEAKPSATAKPAASAAAEDKARSKVTLLRLKYDDFVSKVLVNPKAKYTLVDAWASNCGPCKENFPHLIAMHQRFAKDGLAVVSLSLDDTSNPKDVEAAEQFLHEQNARFTNVLLDEEAGYGYEKLGFNAIPAVFLFDPKGKEVQRFTLDDVDHQFTYDQVEAAVKKLLQAEPAH